MVESIDASDSVTECFFDSNVDNFEMEEAIKGHEEELSEARNSEEWIACAENILSKKLRHNIIVPVNSRRKNRLRDGMFTKDPSGKH